MVSNPKADQHKRKGGGPRTAAGKAVSRMNACKHGLSVPVMMDRNLHKTAFEIAYAIAGKDASGAILNQALIVAECELTLRRIRQARVAAIEQEMLSVPKRTDTTAEIADAFIQALPSLSAMERYECRTYSRRKKALAHLHDLQQIARIKF